MLVNIEGNKCHLHWSKHTFIFKLMTTMIGFFDSPVLRVIGPRDGDLHWLVKSEGQARLMIGFWTNYANCRQYKSSIVHRHIWDDLKKRDALYSLSDHDYLTPSSGAKPGPHKWLVDILCVWCYSIYIWEVISIALLVALVSGGLVGVEDAAKKITFERRAPHPVRL